MDIFFKENEICIVADELLRNGSFSSAIDEERYKTLLEEYKKLLKQMRRLVKMSDRMQGELKILSGKLEKMSITDPLTGLYNRRFFNELYQKEWYNAIRLQQSLAILMIDIDYFKKYNDTYGHLSGDTCLEAVAKAIQNAVKRPRDMVARYGGEEFVILLTESDNEGAGCVARQVIANVKELGISHAASPVDSIVSVSVGIASLIPNDTNNLNELLNMADEALYQAKADGRNCISTSEGVTAKDAV